jgi:hypothetical protein
MKANKALKRLARIKALISDVTKRYSASAPHLRDVLQYAEDAVARAKEAVGLHASAKPKGRAKAGSASKKAKSVQKKAAVKKVAARTTSSAKKTPVTRAGKKRAPAPPTQTMTKAPAQ